MRLYQPCQMNPTVCRNTTSKLTITQGTNIQQQNEATTRDEYFFIAVHVEAKSAGKSALRLAAG